MRARWDDYEYALARLEEETKRRAETGDSLLIRRYEAEKIMGMSSGVFEREVRLSSLFRAYYEPWYTGRASSYRLNELVAHMQHLMNDKEIATLIYYQAFGVMPPMRVDYPIAEYPAPGFRKENDEEFEGKYEYIFAPGTNTPSLGGQN